MIVGGVEDHVHLLANLARTCQAAEMVKEVKRGSSLWIKEQDAGLRDFAWQNGYGMFSIGFSQLEEVRRYIAGQEEHHRNVSFQDEFRRLLQRYEIPYDDRYVWDGVRQECRIQPFQGKWSLPPATQGSSFLATLGWMM
jgi:putative transposase